MNNEQLNALFSNIAEELDISDTLFARAERSYKALGEYIGNHCDSEVEVYAQGSFRLGTVIRPLSDEDDYDLDLVTKLTEMSGASARRLKGLIGDILSESDRYSSKLEEKKRCWRIDYADEAQFHMDITPAIPANRSAASIQVTNKNDDGSYSYTASNPKGYADWFETCSKMNAQTTRPRESASVEPVKTSRMKVPLQKAVQILKRHRDVVFEDEPDDKPISIIITTLAAQAYGGDTGVYDALKRILINMPSYLKEGSDGYYIPNPTNPQENFADKWNSEPAKARAFFNWLEAAKRDIVTVAPTIVDDYTALEESLGETVVGRALYAMAPTTRGTVLTESEYRAPAISTVLAVSHRQRPSFKLPKYYNLGIKAFVVENEVACQYKNNGSAIPKNCPIEFTLLVPPNLQNMLKSGYTVKWQVVNTGDEARNANCLRGGFESEANTLKRRESTEYRGTHYVQAFLLRNGKCMGMSREYIVNIK
jgi:hypothetical protein